MDSGRDGIIMYVRQKGHICNESTGKGANFGQVAKAVVTKFFRLKYQVLRLKSTMV